MQSGGNLRCGPCSVNSLRASVADAVVVVSWEVSLLLANTITSLCTRRLDAFRLSTDWLGSGRVRQLVMRAYVLELLGGLVGSLETDGENEPEGNY